MEKNSERDDISFRNTLTNPIEHNDIVSIATSLEKQSGEKIKESLQQLLFLISNCLPAPEGQPIQGSETVIDKVTNLLCRQNDAEIHALCLSILLNINSKSQPQDRESHICILCLTLIEQIQSRNKTISECASNALISAMKKMKEFKQFLVQRGIFLRKATEILLRQEQSSYTLATSQNEHSQSAVLDILLILTSYNKLKWNREETNELINVIQIMSGDEQEEKDEETMQGKANILLPLLRMKLSSDGSIDLVEENERLKLQLHQSEEQRINVENDKRISEEQSRMKDDQIRKAEEELKNKEFQVQLLQQQLFQSTSITTNSFICALCGQASNEQIKCEKCSKERCRKCSFSCNTCKGMNCKSCSRWCDKCNKPECQRCFAKGYLCSGCNKQLCLQCSKQCAVCSLKCCDDCVSTGEICSECNKMTSKNCFRKCQRCNKPECKKCYGEGIKCQGCNKSICQKCIKKCEACSKQRCSDCVSTGDKCYRDNKMTCKICKTKCKTCQKLICDNHVYKCSVCQGQICYSCRIRCGKCNKNLCNVCSGSFLGWRWCKDGCKK